MKKTIVCLLSLLISVSLAAQQQVRPQQTTNNAASNGSIDAVSEGYGNLSWGVLLSEAKNKIEGRLFFTDDQKIIISKDGELEYHYGFFYMDPGKYAAAVEQNGEAQANDEGKLFYVSLKFPYLTMDTVKQKLTDKYGEPTFEEITQNTGATAWDTEKTIIILWVEQYEKQAFSRRINYISKETTKELNDYMDSVFHQTEIDVIKKLNP